MNKVLIITYYWPPYTGSGVQRWLKFSKYLPKYSWKPIIYTPENPYSDLTDDSLFNDMSNDLEVIKSPIWEPYHLKDKIFGVKNKNHKSGIINKKSFSDNFFNFIRGNFFIPDPKIFWVKPSIKLIKEKLKKDNINYIITTGPPHSMHLIGLGIKKYLPNIKWIADFRDPWSQLDILNEFHLLKFSINKHKQLERKVLDSADVVLTVSESWANDFKNLGAKNCCIITNGYDLDDFNFQHKKTDKFIIGHYGLLNHLRNPKNLWSALDRICTNNIDFDSRLELHFSGSVSPQIIDEIKSYKYLKSKIKLFGYINHTDVIKRYAQSSILLLLLFNSSSGIGNYPGKIFEYFATKKPILAFGPLKSDVEKLFRRKKIGSYISYNESNIDAKILDLFNNKFTKSQIDFSEFTRENLTIELVNILNSLK